MEKKKELSRLGRIALVLVMVASFLLTVNALETSANTIKLNFNHWGSEKGLDPGMLKWWCQEVEKRTKSKVKFTMYWGGMLAKPKEVVQAVRKGLCDISTGCPPWFPSEMPLNNIGTCLVGRCPEGKEVVYAFHQLMKEYPVLEKEYEGLNQKLLISWCNPLYFLSCTKPFRKLDDLKGNKFRGPSSSLVTLINQMGGVGVFMPSVKAFEAMDKGMIQGAMGSMDMCKKYHWYEVSKYLVDVGLGCNGPPTFIVTINLDKWNALPADVQKVMIETGEEFVGEWDRRLDTAVAESEKFLINEQGMVKIKFSAEDISKIHSLPIYKTSREEWIDSVTAKGYPGKAMLDRYLELIGIE